MHAVSKCVQCNNVQHTIIHIVESGYLSHALIGIITKFYAPHNEVRQIAGVYGGTVDHAPPVPRDRCSNDKKRSMQRKHSSRPPRI